MGIRLIVEVLDQYPRDLTPAERLVLVAIAEAARDETREGWPGMELLIRRTGLSRSAVTKILQRLARRRPPIEVRVSIGKGHDGRLVYASRGRRTTYRLPPVPTRKGGPPSTLSDEKGWTTEPERVDHGPLKGGPPSTPSPQSPQEPSSPRASKPTSPLAALGATEDEIKIVEEKIQTEHQPRNLIAYIAGIDRADLAGLLDDVRAGQRRTALAAAVALAKLGPECVDGVAGGDDPDHPQCPLCRRRRKDAA